ncbi:histidine phosphatase family protein [Streptomyces sp. HNM0663]|uniref:Histidine phosphatase family protein n=1 Tax=Streptomyces chengmaiensis TaxID=3040919 RepID=A0ABT6HKY3_9ACTN|nr:histidine phosphatase family protein [Streptomyces chengmaiensis]MDH2388534.1 histidine phosphatase family protein [Streptomyces chengmaiensis]
MITTELVFVRHGEAQCNVDGLVGGPRTCTGLTNHGYAQVERAALRLAAEHRDKPFDALYTGPRIRLRQTAEIISQALRLPISTDDRLDGPVHGVADGQPWTEVKTTADGGPHAHPDKPWAAGSDTWNGYLERASRFLRELIDQHEGERVLFAAHGETVIVAHTLLLGIPLGSPSGFTVSHGSITRWQHHLNRLGQRRWMLDHHNDTEHLAALGQEAAS